MNCTNNDTMSNNKENLDKQANPQINFNKNHKRTFLDNIKSIKIILLIKILREIKNKAFEFGNLSIDEILRKRQIENKENCNNNINGLNENDINEIEKDKKSILKIKLIVLIKKIEESKKMELEKAKIMHTNKLLKIEEDLSKQDNKEINNSSFNLFQIIDKEDIENKSEKLRERIKDANNSKIFIGKKRSKSWDIENVKI